MVMPTQLVEAERTLTADTTDVLGSTDLRQAPGAGAVAVFLASTVADTLATVSIGGRLLKNNTVIGKVATNAQIDALADTPVAAQVEKGDIITVNIDVVTAATVRVKAIWQGVLGL